jgi:hypothetical protein
MRGGRRWTVGRQLNAFRLDRLALLFLSLYSEEFFVVDFLTAAQVFPIRRRSSS